MSARVSEGDRRDLEALFTDEAPEFETTLGAIPFITDDEIARRLQTIENWLAHLEGMVPAMRREIAALRGKLEPRR